MLGLTSIVAHAPGLVSTEVQGEAVVLNVTTGTYHGLGNVGLFIWNQMEQPISVVDIKDALLRHFDIDSEKCELDLFALLADMGQHGLISITQGNPRSGSITQDVAGASLPS